MAIGTRRQNLNIATDKSAIKHALHYFTIVAEFQYLGATLTKGGRIDTKLDIRCNKANQMIGQLAPLTQHTNLPINTKKHLIQSILMSTLCYQC